MRSFFSFCLCFLFSALVAGDREVFYLEHPDDSSKKIEVVKLVPEGQTSFPLLVFVHGVSMKKGANDFGLKNFQYWIDKGYAIAAISLPGFGKSDGRNDFGGPFTIKAMHAAVDHLKRQMPVSSMGIIGFGLGGFATTILASQRDDLNCVVIANGGYDLQRLKDENDLLRRALINSQVDMLFTEEAIQIRSPMEIASSLHCPLFIVHRKLNPMVTANEVILFQETVNRLGGNCSLMFLSGGEVDYKITYQEVIEVAGDWIEQYLEKAH